MTSIRERRASKRRSRKAPRVDWKRRCQDALFALTDERYDGDRSLRMFVVGEILRGER